MAEQRTPRLNLPIYTSGADEHPTREDFNDRMLVLEGQVARADHGPHSDRPTPSTEGSLYLATDTGLLWYDTGAEWVRVVRIGNDGPGRPIAVAGSGAEGTSVWAARADHTHPLPLATGTTPGALPAADKAKLDAATANSDSNALAQRDASGRISVGTPGSNAHAATKQYVDQQRDTRAPLAHTHHADDVNAGTLAPARLPAATTNQQGALGAADKAKLDAATANATASTLAQRDASGRISVGAPAVSTHAATRGYVDELRDEAVLDRGNLGSQNLNNVTAQGFWTQGASSPVTTENNYPRDGNAGTLVVHRVGSGDALVQTWTDWLDIRVWRRRRGSTGTWTGWVEFATTALATSSADGLMPSTDKAKLDAATSLVEANALAQRNSAGQISVAEPTAAAHTARKSNVDALRDESVLDRPSLGTRDLNEVTEVGFHHQPLSANATAERNYPGDAVAGALTVQRWGTTARVQIYTQFSPRRIFFRTQNSSGTWGTWVELASTARATSSSDGLMPNTDKAKLDAATASATGNSLAQRDPNGRISVTSPGHANHATPRSYVDEQRDTRAPTSHTHHADDVNTGTLAPARLPAATTSEQGALGAEDKAKLDEATADATADTLVRRNSEGQINVGAPSVSTHAATREYVDDQVAAGVQGRTIEIMSGASQLFQSNILPEGFRDVRGSVTDLGGGVQRVEFSLSTNIFTQQAEVQDPPLVLGTLHDRFWPDETHVMPGFRASGGFGMGQVSSTTGNTLLRYSSGGGSWAMYFSVSYLRGLPRTP